MADKEQSSVDQGNRGQDLSFGLSGKDLSNRGMFDAPIPGQSLTSSPGGHPYERPPENPTEDEALIFVLNEVSNPKKAKKIAAAVDNGMWVSDITNGILAGGVATGKWTPDVAGLIAKRVFSSIVAVSSAHGVKDINYRRPKDQEDIDVYYAKKSTGPKKVKESENFEPDLSFVKNKKPEAKTYIAPKGVMKPE